MKIWVDDERPAPDGYKCFTNTNSALRFIVPNITDIEIIDLDHDMGGNFGGDAINILEELERKSHRSDDFKNAVDKIKFRLHSANPVGVLNMRAIINKNGWTEICRLFGGEYDF